MCNVKSISIQCVSCLPGCGPRFPSTGIIQPLLNHICKILSDRPPTCWRCHAALCFSDCFVLHRRRCLLPKCSIPSAVPHRNSGWHNRVSLIVRSRQAVLGAATPLGHHLVHLQRSHIATIWPETCALMSLSTCCRHAQLCAQQPRQHWLAASHTWSTNGLHMVYIWSIPGLPQQTPHLPAVKQDGKEVDLPLRLRLRLLCGMHTRGVSRHCWPSQ